MTQKGKTVVNCALLRSKAQILRNVLKILRNRMVARLHLLETPAITRETISQSWQKKNLYIIDLTSFRHSNKVNIDLTIICTDLFLN